MLARVRAVSLGLGLQPFGDVADGGGDQDSVLGVDGRQGDLGGDVLPSRRRPASSMPAPIVLQALACMRALGVGIEDMRTYQANRGRGHEAAAGQRDPLNAPPSACSPVRRGYGGLHAELEPGEPDHDTTPRTDRRAGPSSVRRGTAVGATGPPP
jgi:hypothetical protein